MIRASTRQSARLLHSNAFLSREAQLSALRVNPRNRMLSIHRHAAEIPVHPNSVVVLGSVACLKLGPRVFPVAYRGRF